MSVFIDSSEEKRFTESLKLDGGREESKVIWREEAKQHGLKFLCRDIEKTNNGWFEYECGHIGNHAFGDVRREKFCCRLCKFSKKYKLKCEEKNLRYIRHYCEDKQTIIVVECLGCNKEKPFRASSITHHKGVKCETCIFKYRQEIANVCGFQFLNRIDGYWANYKCLICGKEQEKRWSDVSKNEARCECVVNKKNEQILEIISADAKIRGFVLVEKIDSTWCRYKCKICGEKENYQFQAMKIGNVRCRTASCNDKKSRGQQLIEDYLIKLGFTTIKNELIFDDLIGEGGAKLRYDIYYVEKNELKWVIEFDGKQHEAPARFRTSVSEEEAIENFKRQKKHDRMKDEYAQGKFPLLRIKNEEYINNTWREKLDEFLLLHKA